MTYDWYIRTYICLMETRRYRGNSVQDRKKLSESTGEYFEHPEKGFKYIEK